MNLNDAANFADELQEYTDTHKIELYVPYDFQKDFHFAKGIGEFVCAPSDLKKEGLATRRGLMCANQIGKSYCGGLETGFHATGRYPKPGEYFYPEFWPNSDVPCPYAGEDIYPDGWKGHRFTSGVEIICSSTTNETTRDRCQRELLGEPSDEDMLGTGSIPRELIGKTSRKAGVPNALETALIKHISGKWSKVYFKPYEQGAKKFMGYRTNVVWCDEEPPSDIWSQLLRGTLATNGIAYITFTPEEGVTDVVYTFMEEDKPGYGLVRASWDDAPHMTPDMRKQKLADYPLHEQKMRSQGEPMVGTGLIFPVPDEDIVCEPFDIPRHFARIAGFDIGDDHPAALVMCAIDREQDIFYIYKTWRESRSLIPMTADVMRRNQCDWIPVAWPHDGMQKDPKSGVPIAHIYRDEYKINMHHERFSNPPSPKEKEGQGGQGVEVGLQAMLTAMIEGRFKVFSTCEQFFEEKRMYHRRDNQVIKKKDDIMAASRYAYQMQRHAITQIVPQTKTNMRKGLRTW